MRKDAAKSFGKVQGDNIAIFSLVTNTLAKDKEIEDRWRKYPRPHSSRNLANVVEDEVVDALVAVGEGRLSAARAPLLQAQGQVVRRRHDAVLGPQRAAARARRPRRSRGPRPRRSCSTPTAPSRRSWPTVGQKFFGTGWIDAPARPGKSPGAFAHPTVPSAHPYLLLNYQGKVRDVMTLAHELGHGVHQVLAAQQGPLMADTPLTLAETASVFGEMLTFQSLLEDRARQGDAQGDAGRQGRGHAEHGGAPDRLLRFRVAPARRRAARAS